MAFYQQSLITHFTSLFELHRKKRGYKTIRNYIEFYIEGSTFISVADETAEGKTEGINYIETHYIF